MKEIYVDFILDHYKNPRNFGEIKDADFSHADGNPLCGDVIKMDLKVKEGIIVDVKFKGHGCAISMAAASILTELIKDKPLKFAKGLTKDDIFDALGIPIGPTRVKCALLALKVLQAALGELKEVVNPEL